MAKKPKDDETNTGPHSVECVLGDYKNVPGAQRRTDLIVSAPFTRVNCAALSVMMDYTIRIEEPDRGTPRPELPLIHGKIESWKVSRGAKKQNGIQTKEIQIKMGLDFGQLINDGLFQIAEVNPPTLILQQTQMEIELQPEDAE